MNTCNEAVQGLRAEGIRMSRITLKQVALAALGVLLIIVAGLPAVIYATETALFWMQGGAQ